MRFRLRAYSPVELISLKSARFQTSFVALDILETKTGQAELSFLELATDKNEALFFSFAQCLQARAFRRRLPLHALRAVQ